MTLRTSRQKGWIGIELGARAIKMAQVEKLGSRLSIRRGIVFRHGHPFRSSGGNLAQDFEWPSEEIRSALSWYGGFQGRRAACVLSMRATDFRAMNIPAGTDQERRSMIAHKLAAIHGDDGGREFDFWETDFAGEAAASSDQNVAVISVPSDLATRVAQNISGAGLKCEVLDGTPLALARAIEMVPAGQRSDPAAIVDWGFAGATFSVVSGGRPLFTRYLRDCGVGALADALSKSLALSLDEAEELLTKHGLPHPTVARGREAELQEAIADTGSGRLADMAEQLNKTISYLNVHRTKLVPAKIWLFGGGATIKNAAQFLTTKVGVPTVVWRLPEQPPASSDGDNASRAVPTEMLGAAVALSALAWVS